MPCKANLCNALVVYPSITDNKACMCRYTFTPHPFRLHLNTPRRNSMDMPLKDVVELVNMVAG